jgi:hypothetical protein
MSLEIRIRDAPGQDLQRFGEYVYRIRIEHRPDITSEEAMRRRSIVAPGDIPFIEFDLPAHLVAPGCTENWQKSQAVMALKRDPVESAVFLIQAALKFGVLTKDDLRQWRPAKRLALPGDIEI